MSQISLNDAINRTCNHGINPYLAQCGICILDSRIANLEKWMNEHEKEGQEYGNEFEERDSLLIKRIEALEKSLSDLKSHQLDHGLFFENIEKRLDILEKERDIGVERIKKLEEQNAKRLHECTLNARRLSELEAKEPILSFAAIEGVTPEVKIYNEKKEGLTFAEALKYFYEGKKIRRKSWINVDYFIAKKMPETMGENLAIEHFSANDWMVLDD